MKLFKKLALLCTAITLCTGVCAFSACGGDDSSSSSASSTETSSEATATANAYKFKVVKADGTPAVGYRVLICIANGACQPPVTTDANGEATVIPSALGGTAGEYEIHVMSDNLDSSDYLEYTGLTVTPTAFSNDVITLTLK